MGDRFHGFQWLDGIVFYPLSEASVRHGHKIIVLIWPSNLAAAEHAVVAGLSEWEVLQLDDAPFMLAPGDASWMNNSPEAEWLTAC
jgi:hypothetical protein